MEGSQGCELQILYALSHKSIQKSRGKILDLPQIFMTKLPFRCVDVKERMIWQDTEEPRTPKLALAIKEVGSDHYLVAMDFPLLF